MCSKVRRCAARFGGCAVRREGVQQCGRVCSKFRRVCSKKKIKIIKANRPPPYPLNSIRVGDHLGSPGVVDSLFFCNSY